MSVSLYFGQFNILYRKILAQKALERAKTENTKCHWDDVEELFEELAEYKMKVKSDDPLEKYCEGSPSALECRIYDS